MSATVNTANTANNQARPERFGCETVVRVVRPYQRTHRAQGGRG